MFFTTLIAIGVAGGLGLLAMVAFRIFGGDDFYGNSRAISWAEFWVVFGLMTLIIAPSVTAVGNSLSVAQLLSYQQFVNGVEIGTSDVVTTCLAGHEGDDDSAGRSNCRHTYISGYYDWQWIETVTTCTSDSKGNQTCTTSYVTHYETSPIYTPYATREHAYTINSSMGAAGSMSYTFPYAYLDERPVRHPQSDREIPGDILRGAPADWTDADNRFRAGDPRAVTKVTDYDNYILASKDEVLKTYGARLDQYLKAGLLPDHTANINSDPITGPSRSQADKVSFVGVTVSDPGAWQRSVMRFNAALGMKLQGDLHVVLVDSNKVPSIDSVPYTQALKAYWQSETFGKRALAKNGIILVLGVNTLNNTVDWSDASTGMPFGNETMIQFLRDDLPGKALEPSQLFGTPRTVIKGDQTTIMLTTPRGLVEEILFDKAAFKRARMSCNDNTCVGYKDLISKIEPTADQKNWMVIVTAFISLILWLVVGFTSFVGDFLDVFREWIASLRGKSTKSSRRDVTNFTHDDIDRLLKKQYEPYSLYDQSGRRKRYGRNDR